MGVHRGIDNFAADGNTLGMKVAVSIPDPVFSEAERLAKQLKTSRSEIYARALRAFVGLHSPDRLTQAMDEAVEAAGSGQDELRTAAARRVFERTEW